MTAIVLKELLAFGTRRAIGLVCDLKCGPRTFSSSKENEADEGNLLFSSPMRDFIAFVFLKKRQVLALKMYIFIPLGSVGTFQAAIVDYINTYLDNL